MRAMSALIPVGARNHTNAANAPPPCGEGLGVGVTAAHVPNNLCRALQRTSGKRAAVTPTPAPAPQGGGEYSARDVLMRSLPADCAQPYFTNVSAPTNGRNEAPA